MPNGVDRRRIMFYGKLPIVFLAELASGDSNSTNSQIAAYILNHLEEVRNDSIRELARKCFVSISSISRFCREMGLNDYSELRELIADTELKFEVCSNHPEPQMQMEEYIRSVQDSIRLVQESLNPQKLVQLAEDIHCYKKVSVFGLLKAETAAMNLQSDLLMLGKLTTSKVRYHKQIEYLEQADEDDLVIIFSYTGIYFDYQYLPHRINKNIRRPKIWFITSGKHVRPDAFLNEVIYFESRQNQASHPYQLQVIAGLIAQAYAHFRIEQGENVE